MFKRFNTLKSTPQILITAALFAFIAILSIPWGLVLCIIALPTLTFFNYANAKPFIVKTVHSALSLVAGFIALLPALEIDSNRRVSACNAGDDIACQVIVDDYDTEWELVTNKNALRLIELKKQEIANAKAEKAMQKAEKYKKEAKGHGKEAEGLEE